MDGTPFIHIEAKRTEKFAPYAAMRQAEESLSKSKSGEFPVVTNRKNNMKMGESLVVMRADDWVVMYQAYLREHGVALGATKSTFEAMLNASKDSVQP